MAKKIVDQSITPEALENLAANMAPTEPVEAKAEVAEAPIKKGPVKKGAKKVRGANYAKARKALNKDKSLEIHEAIKEIRKAAYAKFNESVELHINLGIDKSKSDQRVRFVTSLPHGIGKKVKILVLSEDNSGVKEDVTYRNASAVDEIVSGKLKADTDFNIVIATPAMMKDIAKAAKILGPKGLMPSPKMGTVTDKPEKAIADLSKGQIEVKTQPSHAVIHQTVGNLKFTDEELVSNIAHLLAELNKNTPAKIKKKFITGVYVCSTMSPSVKIAA
jgi:large subunit ribosomal protein L1